MADLGLYNTLKVQELAPHGAYLDDEDGGQILLPTRQVPEDTRIGDELNVFVYLDSEDRWIATMQRPRAQLHQAGYLEAIDVNNTGAFLDWGLAKDLFVPFAEQKHRIEHGNSYIVYIYLDNTGRLTGTTKVNRFIRDEARANWPGAPDPFNLRDKVKLLIAERTEMGYKAIVNDEYWGLIHHDDIRKAIRVGQKVDGYIKNIRDDHRLDLSLEPIGHAKAAPLARRILKKLDENNGELGLSDRSDAEIIELHFGVSKRAFKMALGQLYKEREIIISANSIRRTTDEEKKAPIAKKSASKPLTNKKPQSKKTGSANKAAAADQSATRQNESAKPQRKRFVNKKSSANTLSIKRNK